MRAHGTRVLMLGWEYPPRFAGGLGKACQGLAQAMARAGAQIYFVLPTFPGRLSEEHLEVIGARECLIEAGWEMASPWAPSDARALEGERVPPKKRFFRELSPGISASALEGISWLGIATSRGLWPYESPKIGMPEPMENSLFQGREEGNEKPSQNSPSGEEPKNDIYGQSLWLDIEHFSRMTRLLSETHEVDVVHAHDWMTFPAAFEFQRMTGCPVFVHVHATEYDRSGESLNNDVFRIEREGFRRATHIFAVSRYTAGIIERLYGVNRKKITVIYNAPEGGMKPLSEGGDAPRKPQVVFLGRLTFQKGPDHFLRAASLVATSSPGTRFILCGSGDMLGQLRELAERLGIGEQTHFAGFVEPAAVDALLLESKLLVMPSVSEPFGLVALEAIRCGLPIIISKQSGVREVLHRALQVDFWDHERLADQMSAALRLPGLSRQLVEEGMGQVLELSWERSARKVIETYQRFRNSGGSTYAHAIGGGHGH